MKIYNSNYNEKLGYVFEGEDIVIVEKATGKAVGINELGRSEEEVLLDASKAYILNDVYEPMVDVEPEEEPITEDIPVEVKQPVEVEEDIQHQIDAKDFGEYLIVIGDYGEQDFEVFAGSKEQLNAHIAELHLHQTPRVYALKQLQVKTKYEVM